MFTIDCNEATGLIRLTSSGFLAVEDVQQYYEKVLEAVTEMRRTFGSFKLLVVSVDAVVQSSEVMQASQANKAYALGPRDRMAMVTKSALAIRQGARTYTDERERVFGSESEAMAWLMSEDAQAPVRGDVRQTPVNSAQQLASPL